MESADIYSIVQLGIIGLCGVLVVIGACIAGPIIARYWYQARRVEMETALKQSMLERGMTAEQICAVIEASEERRNERSQAQASADRPPCPPSPPNVNDWKQWANEWRDWAHHWKGRRARV
jgi:hypothetical protein